MPLGVKSMIWSLETIKSKMKRCREVTKAKPLSARL